MMKFYDTSSLLVLQERAFDECFAISSITLQELENIKTSQNKDGETKFKARKLVRLLDKYRDKYEVVIADDSIYEFVDYLNLPTTNDNLIVSCCNAYKDFEDVIFCTDDICLKIIAENIFDLKTISSYDILKNDEAYLGYKEITMTDIELESFYWNLSANPFKCLPNEYLVIKDLTGDIVEVKRWTGNEFVDLFKKNIKTFSFGDIIKPKDPYQAMMIDSIYTNILTIISGKAGSGKSLLSLASAMNLIESGKYDTLVILFNPTKTRGTADMGYYSGDMLDKAMQNSVGNILSTKFGDKFAIEMLMQQNKLKLVSMADIRGMEIRDNEILYITECQNTSIDLLKLCLSRASEGSKIILEGDFTSQVDNSAFENFNNGMKRAIEVLKGENIFGYVELKNVYRSKIANLVEKM